MDDIDDMATQAEAEIETHLPPDLEPLVLFAQRYPLLTMALTAGATVVLMTLLRPPRERR